MRVLLFLLLSSAALAADKPQPAFVAEPTFSTAYALELVFKTDKVAEYRKWLSEQTASHKNDILIEFDGRRTEMSFEEFERRVFQDGRALQPN